MVLAGWGRGWRRLVVESRCNSVGKCRLAHRKRLRRYSGRRLQKPRRAAHFVRGCITRVYTGDYTQRPECLARYLADRQAVLIGVVVHGPPIVERQPGRDYRITAIRRTGSVTRSGMVPHRKIIHPATVYRSESLDATNFEQGPLSSLHPPPRTARRLAQFAPFLPLAGSAGSVQSVRNSCSSWFAGLLRLIPQNRSLTG